MNTFWKNTTSIKKFRWVFIVIVILIIVIPACLLLFANKKNPISTVIIPSTPSNTLAVLNNGSYTLTYPKTWSESEGAGVNGGTVVYLQPSNVDPRMKSHVILQVIPETTTNINRMNMIYSLLKYQKLSLTVSGISAVRYSATLASVNGPYHSIAYIFTHTGNLYLLELGYTQNNTDGILESEFTQIVDNFAVH